MKIVVSSPADVTTAMVRQIAEAGGLEVNTVAVVEGPWRIAVEYDEDRGAIEAEDILALAREAGADELTSSDVITLPRWAGSLLGFATA
jgi:hypothetical protein